MVFLSNDLLLRQAGNSIDFSSKISLLRGGQGSYYDDEEDNNEYNSYSYPKEPSENSRYTTTKDKKAGFDANNLFKDQKRVGATLLFVGILLTLIGMTLFFEGNLLRLGNICIIFGVPLLVGPNNVRQFFMQSNRMQATVITSLGILLVFFGKPRLGILCELFGLLNLFGNMLPLLLAIAKRLPIIGDVLSGLEGGSNNGKPRRYGPDF